MSLSSYRRRRLFAPGVEPLEVRRLMHAGHDHGDGLESLRVDAGSTTAYTDAAGNVWQADSGFAGGGVDTKAFPVAGTTDDKLYTTRRAGEFNYTHPAADGHYTLNLHFADWVTTTGTRKFNVSAEGQTILTNFDVAAAGGSQRALVKSFDVTVTGGIFDLAFVKVVGNPVLSGFELIPKDDQPDPTAPADPSELFARTASSTRIDLNWADNSDNETGFEIWRSIDGGVTFTPHVVAPINATAYADTGLNPATRYIYKVRSINGIGESGFSNDAEGTTTPAPTPPAATTLRVDAAGNANFTDSTGKVWSADTGFTGGYANTSLFAVNGTVDDALYATRRTGAFSYAAPIANGEYTLRLLFADYYAVGQRKFNVDAEGQRLLTNFDISADGGVSNAVTKTFRVTVADGTFNLSFANVVGNAALSAFELVPAGPATLPNAPSNLVATGLAGGKVKLTWTDNAGDESGFQIERSTNGNWQVIANLGIDAKSYEDSGLTTGTAYTYRVRATNTAGPSAWSNQAIGTPTAGSPTDTFMKVTWSTVAAAPIGKAEALHAVVDGKLYVFAGFASQNGPVVRSDVYDPATNKWTRIADMPRRLSHAGVAVDGRDVYFAGGYIGTGPGYQQQFGTEEVWKYNVDTNQYTRTTDLPAKLAGGGLVVVGRNMHYFGGNNASRQDVAVHYVLNLDNPSAGWVARKSMTTARSHMGYVNFNGKIYAIGGQKGNDDKLVAQSVVEVYDPATNTWAAKKSMPKGVNHISGATFVMGGRILTLGGQTSHNSPIANAYAYNPQTDQWVSLTSLPAARFSGVGAVIDNTIYFTGGSSQVTTWKGIPG